jgi:hypothetical protein
MFSGLLRETNVGTPVANAGVDAVEDPQATRTRTYWRAVPVSAALTLVNPPA